MSKLGKLNEEIARCYEEKAGQLVDVIWIVYKKYGNEGLDPIKKYFFEYGVKKGKELHKKINNDLRDFVPTLASLFAGGSLFTMENPTRAEKKVIEYREKGCPLMGLSKKRGIREDIICDVFHEIDKGIAKGAELKMTCDQGLADGKEWDYFKWELP
jgi:hypothetical protein